jgi:hypothetical protein
MGEQIEIIEFCPICDRQIIQGASPAFKANGKKYHYTCFDALMIMRTLAAVLGDAPGPFGMDMKTAKKRKR